MVNLINKLTMKEAGRKFRAFQLCLLLSSAAFASIVFVPELLPALGLYLTAVGGLFIAYLGGNIGAKYVTMRHTEDDTAGD